ncbi:MAG: von Willebrand factor type A domain-containing protein, partial [Planctomycetota bacterium]
GDAGGSQNGEAPEQEVDRLRADLESKQKETGTFLHLYEVENDEEEAEPADSDEWKKARELNEFEDHFFRLASPRERPGGRARADYFNRPSSQFPETGGRGGGGGGGKLNRRFSNPFTAAAERELRAYRFWKDLDPSLQLDQFRSRPLTIDPPAIGDEGLGRDGFRERYGVNPFVSTRKDAQSTFGMDVDTASYSLTRAHLRSGKLPEAKAVRVEEFINSFPADLVVPDDEVFTAKFEGGPSPFGTGTELLKITVKSRALRPDERKNAVLTFAVDTSGSMALGGRLALVKKSLTKLTQSLRESDRVAIVAFGDGAFVALSPTAVRERSRILDAISSLSPSGSTNVESGLELAYRIADESFAQRAMNRVILCSDGVANVGASGPTALVDKVRVYASRGIYLSAVGFGMGQYRDATLQELADRGNGNYAYVDGEDQARRVFEQNLPATLQVLAQDAKIQVEFDAEAVEHYRLLGYEKRDIADKDFRNDKVDAGEVGPGTTVTVLYEISRRRAAFCDLGKLFLRYRDTGTERVEERNFEIPQGVIATSLDRTSDRFRFIASVAEFAELLRESYYARDGSLGSVLELLDSASEEFQGRPEWREVSELCSTAQALTVSKISATAAPAAQSKAKQ